MTKEGVRRKNLTIISVQPIFAPKFSLGKRRSIVIEILRIVEGEVFLVLMVEKGHDTHT